MSNTRPSLSGTLASRPLFQIMVQLLEKRWSGTLVVEEPAKAKSAIYVWNGVPVKAMLPGVVLDLGTVLRDLAIIDEATYRGWGPRAAGSARSWLGEGKVDEADLRTAQRELLIRQVLEIGSFVPECCWGFYQDRDYLESVGESGAEPPDPLTVIWRLIRRYQPSAQVSAAVSKLGDPELHLHRAAQIARFGFVPPETALVDVLRAKPQKLSELAARQLAPLGVVERLVYALVLTRHLDCGPGMPPIGVSEKLLTTRSLDRPTSTIAIRPRARLQTPSHEDSDVGGEPPPVSSAEATAFRAELEAKHESLGSSNYYEALGVARNTSTEDIQNAFLGLVKKWHPDRLRPELSELRPKVEQVFARIAEAHQTLSDESRRKQYDELLGQGGGSVDEQEHVQAVIRAVAAYQRAEVYLKKHSIAEAELEAKKAVDNDPDQADYLALYAWILSQKDPPTRPLSELIEMMDKAVAGSAKSVRNRFYRGQLLKRAGEDQRALADFRWVVQTDPRHVDAQRELRIYGMRGSLRPQAPPRSSQGKSPASQTRKGPPEGKGLFGKLFKK